MTIKNKVTHIIKVIQLCGLASNAFYKLFPSPKYKPVWKCDDTKKKEENVI